MRIIHRVLCVLCLFFFAGAGFAAPTNNPGYQTLRQPQITEAGNKVEVVEFFAYYCPHCYSFDRQLAEWVKRQGENVVFKRVHATMTGEPMPQQRLYYTLQVMGKEEEFHKKILNAIHVQKLPLNGDDEIIGFMVNQGMDRQKFTDAYHSFAVQSKVTRAIQMQVAYQIASWPSVAIDGRYVTSPQIIDVALQNQNEMVAQASMLKVMDVLVAQQHLERSKPEAQPADK
jgi:thiol:disulfide interchange protein DsbA